MRPPSSALHPRSRFTSSLFATTLFASFFIVALPHVLPCPAPRGAFTDDGSSPTATRRRRRRVIVEPQNQDEATEGLGGLEEAKPHTHLAIEQRSRPTTSRPEILAHTNESSEVDQDNPDDPRTTGTKRRGSRSSKRTARECPVPKPSGLLGEMLGFKMQSPSSSINQRGVKEEVEDERSRTGALVPEAQRASASTTSSTCPIPTPGGVWVGEMLGFKKISTPRSGSLNGINGLDGLDGVSREPQREVKRPP